MLEFPFIIFFSIFPFFVSLYFFHFYFYQTGKNLFDFLNDLTDHIVLNENFFAEINCEEENFGSLTMENPNDKEKDNLPGIEQKYEEKYIDRFYLNNTDLDLSNEEVIEKENYLMEEKKNWENKWINLTNEIAFWKEELIKNYNPNVEEWMKDIQKKIGLLEKKKDELGIEEEKINDLVLKKIYGKRLEKLKNSFIMEKTPLGNVVIYYNVNRESFEYFSDNTIPYRFLEVVARKYVITFKCRFIYIMMEEELKKYEKKMEQMEIQKKLQEEQIKNNLTIPPKKNLFATFKSYNKESGSGRVVKAPPPKNNIPNNKINSKNTKEKIILKENANRYTYVGRFSNFSPLKKIERNQVDKKYSISFSEFKKLQIQS